MNREKQRKRERERWLEQEKKDLEVEKKRGPRPLEGFAGGHTTWTGEQNDAAAPKVHSEDLRKSLEASQKQAEGKQLAAERIAKK
ncbi:MAG: hypothetical protein ACYC8T_38860 [Myxococcaceae bacterium]